MTLNWLLQLAAILPLSLAAGVDLYLALLFLGTAGSLGWETPAPGALGDLAVPTVLGAAVVLYMLERWMEGRPFRWLCWNAAHTVIRPMAGVLLTLMALADLPSASRIAGAVAAGALTLATQITRSGWGLLLGLESTTRMRFLISVAEDVVVLALLSLLLDAPIAAAMAAALFIAAGLLGGRSASDAFGFALRVLWDRSRAFLEEGRWQGPERFPAWIRKALEDPALAPVGGLRGSPAGAVNLPGLGHFRSGWVVVRGGSPVFLYRRKLGAEAVDLGTASARGVTPSTLTTRVELGSREGHPFSLYFSLDGPGPEDLRAEFQV